jgi:nanoRNase/pAp phosphatase (c-di-AMP/oligoRNAs hydrolase)
MSDYLMNSDLTPKQQTSEALRQAETILITTAQRPNVDQVAAVIALAAILRKFGKRVSAVISDPIPAAARFLPTREIESKLSGLRDFVINLDTAQAEVESLRYEVLDNKLSVFITPFKGEFKPQDVSFAHGDFHFDLAVVVGVGSRSRIDRIYAENQALFASIPVVNIDYRRSNENFGAINLIDPYASSLCEILFALSESLQSGMIDADIATVMLAGLMASTEQFTAAHTSPKSLTMAAQFMAAGARQQEVVKGLHGGGERPAASRRRD